MVKPPSIFPDFRLNKVAYKIFLVFFAVICMITAAMSILIQNSFAQALKRNEINFHMRNAVRTREQFDFIMEMIDNTARTLCARREIVDTLANHPDNAALTQGFLMNSYLRQLKEVQPLLGSVTIAGTNGSFYSSDVLLTREDIKGRIKQYTALFSMGLLRGYFVDERDPASAQWGRNHDVITGVWPIYDYRTGKLAGQLYLGLNYSFFQDMFIIAPIENNERVVILDDEDNIVYSYPSPQAIGGALADYPELTDSASGDFIMEGMVNGAHCIIAAETSQAVGWRFITVKDAEYAMEDTRHTQELFNTVLVIALVISLAFSVLMSYILTKPIKLLADACERIEKSDHGFRVNIKTRDELGQLGRTFNMMMDELHSDFERQLSSEKRQNEMKLEVLRAQINPHFLYNTLDSIKFLANLQEAHSIASMSAALINLLKYNLSPLKTATLAEEMESVGNYVSLQKYRYGDIFELKTDIADNARLCVIPRFILQPLVENSLLHGFEDMEGGGEITIRARLEEGESEASLHLEVLDNGCGMDGETLTRINGDIDSQHNGDIGITNIRERIRLQFAGRATLVIESESGKGTRAEMRFPG
jgi:two-component system sensor histidine kinase YesM